MLSNNKSLGLLLLLGGCASNSGGGYGDAPRIDSPTTEALESRYQPAPEPSYAPEPPRGGALQNDYPPEPGAPGAGYGRPGEPSRQASPYRTPPPERADVPPAVAESSGPRGTSGEQQRYDAVGYAGWYGEEPGGAPGGNVAPGAITAAHRTLPLNSVAEVTALDTGRTILVLITDRGPSTPDREIDLSRGAAQQLGLTAVAPVRVRLVIAAPTDHAALRAGRPAEPRIDAPPSLLTALRRKLPGRPAPVAYQPRVDRPAPPAPRPAAPRTTSGIFVQVAALSSETRAQALATELRGRVQRIGALYRVQVGPFATNAQAQRARDDVARRGYGDARIVKTN